MIGGSPQTAVPAGSPMASRCGASVRSFGSAVINCEQCVPAAPGAETGTTATSSVAPAGCCLDQITPPMMTAMITTTGNDNAAYNREREIPPEEFGVPTGAGDAASSAGVR